MSGSPLITVQKYNNILVVMFPGVSKKSTFLCEEVVKKRWQKLQKVTFLESLALLMGGVPFWEESFDYI